MIQEVVQYLQAHPRLSATLGLIFVLAVVGLWYVIAHHLAAIMTTFITVAGMSSGAVVFYRGLENGLQDLAWIGLFLMLIFPIIFYQAIKSQQAIVAAAPGSGRKPSSAKAA